MRFTSCTMWVKSIFRSAWPVVCTQRRPEFFFKRVLRHPHRTLPESWMPRRHEWQKRECRLGVNVHLVGASEELEEER
jgi:hypothetical protein